jgi:hypothetical protein
MIADLAFAIVLGLSALLSVLLTRRARAAARDYLRFAAALYLALALSDAAAISLAEAVLLARTVTIIVSALAPALLALALFACFERPPSAIAATVLLTPALVAGIAAAATGIDTLAFAPLMAAAFAILALAARHWRTGKRAALHATISSLCLIAGAAAFLESAPQGRTAMALFSAVSLLGISLALSRSALPIEKQRTRRAPIGAKR